MTTSFFDFLSGLRLRHFNPYEIAFLGTQNRTLQLNEEPPPHLWPNIVQTAWIADLAREQLSYPIHVLSGYRNEAYNKAIGGASRSSHLRFHALDLAPTNPDHTSILYTILRKWQQAGVFLGGLGHYPTFVHFDTRGINANW